MVHFNSDSDKAYYDGVRAFAERTGQLLQFHSMVWRLHDYGNTGEDTYKAIADGVDPLTRPGFEGSRCRLFKDFSPYGFEFLMESKANGDAWQRWFNGGLIYHGDHDRGGDGGAPTFSVNVQPVQGWSIHT